MSFAKDCAMKINLRRLFGTLAVLAALALNSAAALAQQAPRRAALARPVAAKRMPAAPVPPPDRELVVEAGEDSEPSVSEAAPPAPMPTGLAPAPLAPAPLSPAPLAPAPLSTAHIDDAPPLPPADDITPVPAGEESAEPDAAAETSDAKNTDDAEDAEEAVVELVTERFPSGAIKIEREMTQDAEGNYLLHGAWRQFDEQGRLIVEGRYERHQQEGLWRKFFRGNEAPLLATAPYSTFSAPFISQATFRAGQLHGKWILTDSKQRKIHEIEFTGGERNGKATWFYPNGAVALASHYEHGRVHGDITQYAPDGAVVVTQNYEIGRQLAERVEFHDAAQKIKKQELTVLQAPLVVKTPDDWANCSLAEFENRGQDEKHGAFAAWHLNGQPARKGEFRYDLPVGKIVFWYANGQKQMEGEYVDGHQTGVWTWWHENGQKAISGEYHDGIAVGKWSWWADTGKLAQKADMTTDTAETYPTPEADETIREAEAPNLDPEPSTLR
jgi:antitoxin component YwqK of YwqJK toxin-antitoxin module